MPAAVTSNPQSQWLNAIDVYSSFLQGPTLILLVGRNLPQGHSGIQLLPPSRPWHPLHPLGGKRNLGYCMPDQLFAGSWRSSGNTGGWG